MSDSSRTPPPADASIPPGELEPTGTPPASSVRQAPRLTPPTQQQLDALPADRRLELMDLKHQQRHRWLHTFFLAAGIIATVGTLIVGTLTLRSGQEQLNITAEGQVTDRFFKAGEQLGSDKREIRTTAVYALERITKDSERDRLAIRDVLATFIRERDPAPTVKGDKLPLYPDADIAAALTVLARRPADPPGSPPLDLTDLRTPLMIFPPEANLKDVNLGGDSYLASVVLEGADLRDANLFTANLIGANLSDANLNRARLDGANLKDADLSRADLRDAHLNSANLSRANLTGAKLNGADLYDTDLRDADLKGADLSHANLHRARLRSKSLTRANLNGADLRGTGLSEQQVRAATDQVEGTKFGPHPDD
ncbi:hypothetical protein GT755_30625 [Herbidospora sp. NEAU-GS84]|uniref:Pentapeptide repeat-containing protein n=1 Tax=Herbidospora solisilvae TaxID=2696284 RepID=A0A7C9NS18_9ACTN|nr:hypothetical protein [Herbidospora solisilvae]